jgi:predicted MFS family arabinose efflux permease
VAAIIGQLDNWFPLIALPARCAIAALLLLPLGFLLGTPFPSGMRLFSRTRENQVPLVWGLNGVASVVGSLCAAMGAKSLGFNQVLSIGAVCYLVAALLMWLVGQGKAKETI